MLEVLDNLSDVAPTNTLAVGSEIGAIRKDWARHHRIALIYPNTYPVGMTNLGFQRMYQAFNDREDFLCERVFLPEAALAGEPCVLRSCESGKRLQDFDVLAFSISFETDYLNVLRALLLADIPVFQNVRAKSHATFPLILGGGCGVTVNPEPLAEVVDLYCIGEGEDFLPPFCDAVAQRLQAKAGVSQPEFLNTLAQISGAYVPSHFEFVYQGSKIRSVRHVGTGPDKILRLIKKDLDPVPTHTSIIPLETPFRNMFMVETGRGCEWACRFCAAGYIYRYPRERGPEALKKAIDIGISYGMRIGLVGSDMSCHSYIGDIMEYILDRGGKPSLSSIRVEAIDERMAKLIARTGIKTATLAPDAGSFRLRRVLNKNMPDEMIVNAAARLLDAGIRNIKLYFIIGLPTETDEDIEAMIALAEKIRALMKARAPQTKMMGVVSLSINPFVPKPGTPFQWVGLEPKAVIEKRFSRIRQALVAQGSFKVELESYRSCYLQAFISRGDRRAARILLRMLETGQNVDRAAADLFAELQYNPADQIHRTWDFAEITPWDLMDHGFDEGYLEREMRRGFETKLIPNCKPATCRLCGVCE